MYGSIKTSQSIDKERYEKESTELTPLTLSGELNARQVYPPVINIKEYGRQLNENENLHILDDNETKIMLEEKKQDLPFYISRRPNSLNQNYNETRSSEQSKWQKIIFPEWIDKTHSISRKQLIGIVSISILSTLGMILLVHSIQSQRATEGKDNYHSGRIASMSSTHSGENAFLKAFHFTDIHIEPFYDPTNVNNGNCRKENCCKDRCESFKYDYSLAPQLGCDPPLNLLDSMLDAMVGIDNAIDVILFTGDLPAHKLCKEKTVREVQKKTVSTISKALRDIPIIPAIGNNDLFPNNHNSEHNFKALYEIYQDNCPNCALFLGNESTIQKQKESFVSGGYYSYHLSQKATTILVLNSGLWAPRYDNVEMAPEIAENHMKWFEMELQKAKEQNHKLIIMSHIPPGHVKNKDDWFPQYFDRYVSLCSDYKDIILGQFFGHHSKEYIRAFNSDVALIAGSGITPLGGGSLIRHGKDPNNPTFKYLLFSESTLMDAVTFYRDLSVGTEMSLFENDVIHPTEVSVSISPFDDPKASYDDLRFSFERFHRWEEIAKRAAKVGWKVMYSFRETYLTPDISARSLFLASKRILTDSKFSALYQAFMYGLHSPSRFVACDLHTVDYQTAEDCLHRMCLYDVTEACENRKIEN